MNDTGTYSFLRYLKAKKSVDDRALNRHVWANLARSLATLPFSMPLQVLEVGAGVGSMIERCIGWGLLTEASYTAIDIDPDVIAEARRRLPRWADQLGFEIQQDGDHEFVFARGSTRIGLNLEVVDLFEVLEREENHGRFDLVIACALLDLLDLPTALPKLLDTIRSTGLAYFTVNFDGHTIFQPELDPDLDAQIERRYHLTMDQRLLDDAPSGDSRTGRHLFPHLALAGAEIIDAGPSDWVVFPQKGRYPSDEAYFLHFIVNTIAESLRDDPELDHDKLEAWITERHNQINGLKLVYIAHQIDLLAQISH